MTTQTLEALMGLADDYADACFDQALNQRSVDDAPEFAREILEKELRRLHAENEALKREIAATKPAEQAMNADMFWDADEPERCETSINNVVVGADSCRGLNVGDTVTIQRAVKLPDLDVRITMVPDSEGNGDIEWEELAAQAKQEEK